VGRGVRIQAILDFAFDILDHHDGIVDHDAGGQHQAEQRQGIDGKAGQQQRRERADDGHRNGHQGNDAGPPGLQEHHHHQYHQSDGFDEGVNHGFDGAAYEDRRVIVDLVGHALGKVLGDLFHGGAHRGRQIQGIRTGQLEYRDGDGGTAVQHAAQRVVVRPEFDAGDVAQIRGLAVGAVLHHDVAEFLFGLQPALGVDDVLEFGIRQSRLTADLSGGHLNVLFAHGVQNLIDIHVARGDLGGVQPQPHGVIAGAEHLDITHAGQARQHVLDLDDGVIAQIQRVVTAAGGFEEYHHGEVRRLLLGDQAQLTHHIGQASFRLTHAVLGLDLSDIQIRSQLERHGDGKDSIGRCDRVRVNGVLDAVDLLFQRRDYGFRDGLRARRRDTGRSPPRWVGRFVDIR
jgi:hypothetical protein